MAKIEEIFQGNPGAQKIRIRTPHFKRILPHCEAAAKCKDIFFFPLPINLIRFDKKTHPLTCFSSISKHQ